MEVNQVKVAYFFFVLALKSERAAAAFILDEQSFWLHVWSLRSFFPFFPINLYKSVFSAECLLPFLLVWTNTHRGGRGREIFRNGSADKFGNTRCILYYRTHSLPLRTPPSLSISIHIPFTVTKLYIQRRHTASWQQVKQDKTKLYVYQSSVFVQEEQFKKKICMNINDYTIGIL